MTASPPALSRPQRKRLRMCAWCLLAVAFEVFLYASYRGHDARFHWFTHFFVGASAGLVVMAAVAAVTRRPVALPLVWPLAGHVVAMFPDFLFSAGVAHHRWMDVFLGHISTHFVPGRNLTWYLVFLAALGLYLAVLDRLRAQARGEPASLVARVWGEGPPVVFLHGLGASSQYWDALAADSDGYRGIAPDLLGFGRSPKPAHASYDVACHLKALAPLVPDGAVVVGHSVGAVLAAALAAQGRTPMRGVLLVGVPAFPDAAIARAELDRLGPLARLTVRRPVLARLVCHAMCVARPLATALGPRLHGDLPPAVVADGARHTWASYHRTLERVVVGHRVSHDLRALRVAALMLHGEDDRTAPPRYAKEAAEEGRRAGSPVALRVVDGDHHLPVRQPEVVASALQELLARASQGVP